MFQKSKVVIALAIVAVVVLAPMFFKQEKPSLGINAIANNCGVKAYQIPIKSDNVLYIKCKFKNAGVLHNIPPKHGLSAIVGDLLCRKINRLSPEETREKLGELGIGELSIHAFEDDFIISFYVLKTKASEALRFLSPVFSQPEFSPNDLEFIKEKYPTLLELETSHPQDLLLDKLLNMLYQNHNYGRNNTGTAQAIASITADDVNDFIKSNFSRDKLEFFVTGDVSPFKLETYVETLCSKLPEKGQEKLSNVVENLETSALAQEKDATLPRKDMGNIVGAIVGVRLDNLNEKEKAAAHIIIETLFDNKIGDFFQGLRAKNIAYNADFRFLRRNFSNVFFFCVCIDKNDLASYQEYLKDKTSVYPQKINIKDLQRTQNRLIAQSKNGFSNMVEIDEKIKFNSLPFSEVTQEIFADIIKKLFDKSQMRTVYIVAHTPS
jgi:predicted Zn-dependent peptidase